MVFNYNCSCKLCLNGIPNIIKHYENWEVRLIIAFHCLISKNENIWIDLIDIYSFILDHKEYLFLKNDISIEGLEKSIKNELLNNKMFQSKSNSNEWTIKYNLDPYKIVRN